MSFSYSGIIGSGTGKITLPSVESWSVNNNILRDPPKSITTRKIDKVGSDSSLIQLSDESGDRISENISVYAKGINPMVSVSYGNEGNNGGGNGNLVGIQQNGGKQAYLPYRIMKDGVFRPPILTPYQLLPLSRQPRLPTSASTKQGFVDFSKKLLYPDGIYREIKENLKTSVRPTAVFNMNSQSIEPFEVKYVIKNPVKFNSQAGISGFKTQDITFQEVLQPTKEIYKNNVNIEDIYTNHGNTSIIKYVDNSHFNTDKYIQDTLNNSVQSNISKSIQITPIEDIFDIDVRLKDPLNVSYISRKTGYTKEDILDADIDVRLKNPLNVSYTSLKTGYTKEDIIDADVDIRIKNPVNVSYAPIKTGYTKEEYIHDDFELNRRAIHTEAITNKNNPSVFVRHEAENEVDYKRNIPAHKIETNYGSSSIQKNSDVNDRVYNLKPTINSGGYEGRVQLPTNNRIDKTIGINSSALSDKTTRDKFIMDMQQNRI